MLAKIGDFVTWKYSMEKVAVQKTLHVCALPEAGG